MTCTCTCPSPCATRAIHAFRVGEQRAVATMRILLEALARLSRGTP